MLYCPKCQASYTDGTQRFCTNEGARLLPFPSGDSSSTPAEKGVFTSILKKNLFAKEEIIAETSEKKTDSDDQTFEPPIKSKFFTSDKIEETAETESTSVSDDDLILDIADEADFNPLPIARIIDPSSIPELRSDAKTSQDGLSRTTSSVATVDSQQFESLLDLDNEKDIANASVREIENDNDLNLDLDLDDPLDTGELFDSSFDVYQDSSGEDDLLALPSLKSEYEEEIYQTDSDLGIELDLESREEVDITSSIPRIELDLAGVDDENLLGETSQYITVEDSIENETITADEVETPSELELDDQLVDDQLPPIVFENVDVPEKLQREEVEAATNSVIVQPIDVSSSAIKATGDSAWQRRSSENSDNEESRWFLYPLIAIAVLGLGLLSFFYLTRGDSTPDQSVSNEANAANAAIAQQNSNTDLQNANLVNGNLQPETGEDLIPPAGNPTEYGSQPRSALLDVPPVSRNVSQPPNTRYYKNDKKALKGVMAEKFLGFSIYYPKDWVQSNSDNKYLDIAKKASDGLPIKQLLISRYDSNGTFEADIPLFDSLIETSNSDLRRILANYQVISKGEVPFQDGRWRTYEVKFQGIGSDKKLIIWGRRLWIPVQRPGMKSGFIITMIGTSLSKDVKSVEDLGVTDDLAEILKTFEPDFK